MGDERTSIQWCLPPPYEGEWAVLDGPDSSLLSARLAESLGGVSQPLRRTEGIRVLKLEFFPGWLLCDVQASAMAPLEASFEDGTQTGAMRAIESYLYGPDGFTRLDGAAEPIHFHIRLHGLDLGTEERRKDYLRFFCFFVRGEEGPFELIEDAGRIDISRFEPSQKERALGEVIAPLRVSAGPGAGNGSHEFDGCVLYGEQVFEARFRIHAGGAVEMIDDTPLGDNALRVPQTGFAGNLRFLLEGPAVAGQAGP